MRVVSWNCENAARYLARWPHILSALGDPDVLCLQETRIRWRDADRVAEMRSIPGYDAALACADDPRNVTFRGGRAYGVATLVREDLEGTFATPSWDREGRVLYARVGDAWIVNVYAVNGTDKPYWDHDLGAPRGTRHEYKRRFVARLGEDLRRLDGDLVAIGDWNISRTERDIHPRLRTAAPHALARAAFNDVFLPSLDLADAWRERNPEARRYTWFLRGVPPGRDAARVDYALVRRAMLDRVTEAEILDDPPLRFGSDHAPITLAWAPGGGAP
jgi:exodeoxyribonuclease III